MDQINIISKMAPLLRKVDGTINKIRSWYIKNIKNTVLTIKIVDGTKICIRTRYLNI